MNTFCDTCLYENLQTTTKTFSKNDHIFLEGDDVDNVYIIEEGIIKISKLFPNGDEKILEILAKDDFVALLSVLKEHSQYIATATALTEVRLKAIHKEDVLSEYHKNTSFKDACISCATNRVGVFQNQLFESSNQDTEEKILNTLKFLYSKFGFKDHNISTVVLPISKTDLASIIGIRRETLSRKLSLLEEQNRLKIQKNTYQILSM